MCGWLSLAYSLCREAVRYLHCPYVTYTVHCHLLQMGLLYRVFVDWSASSPPLVKTPQRMCILFSMGHNTTAVACYQIVSQYHSSGVLSICITIPQQWCAIKLHHNTTVACSKVALQYHSSGVLSMNHNTTTVVWCKLASKYQNIGVLSICIKIPQVASCQVVSKYHNSGVLSRCITIPQQWHHNTTTVACSQFRSHYRNKSYKSLADLL